LQKKYSLSSYFYINKNEREGKFYETKQKEILAG